MRKYKPVELDLAEAPDSMAAERASCPNCQRRETRVIGMLGRRMVFLCDRCTVRFYRQSSTPQPQT